MPPYKKYNRFVKQNAINKDSDKLRGNLDVAIFKFYLALTGSNLSMPKAKRQVQDPTSNLRNLEA